jgi:membrane-associated phospholipid phosphatase
MATANLTSILRSRYSFHGDIVDRASLPTLLISAGFVIVTATGIACGLLRYRADEINPIAAGLFAIWFAGLGLQFLGLSRLGEAVKGAACYVLVGACAIFASAILAVISRGYFDPVFAAADRALFGVDWKTDVPAMTSTPLIGHVLSYAYVSLNWQPFFMIGYLFLADKGPRFWQALTATAITLVICIGLFPLFPAVGGYVHFQIPHTAVPNVWVPSAWHYPETLRALKDGVLDTLGIKAVEGIVAMPSFHASSAVILAWAFWTTLLRWPFLVLNALMLVSSVPIGGHYIVDVVAGMAVAVLALWLASRTATSGSSIHDRRTGSPALVQAAAAKV